MNVAIIMMPANVQLGNAIRAPTNTLELALHARSLCTYNAAGSISGSRLATATKCDYLMQFFWHAAHLNLHMSEVHAG